MLILPAAGAAWAADHAILRGDVVAERDILVLGDLVANVPDAVARTPLFRAPALGQTGTIQARRIVESAAAAGVPVETGGRLQIQVSRAARQVGAAEIEGALRTVLESSAGLEPRATGIVFDGAPPQLVLSPDAKGEIAAGDLVYDRRNRRFSAHLWVGAAGADRPPSARVSGTVIDTVEVAVVTRALNRGEAVTAGDLTLERRPREGAPSDAITETASLAGRVAKRTFTAGSILRSGDLVRPEIVARGDIVTVVYEAPGMTLTMRAKSADAGAMGDTVSVTNPQSKKTLQATVVGPGKVSVSAAIPGRVASAGASPKR
jgi:flagella basal body P-ring formation protein FlgA